MSDQDFDSAAEKHRAREDAVARLLVEGRAISLSEALRARGYTHRQARRRGAPLGAHDIIDRSGATVATLNAHEAWAWLEGR